MRNYIVISELSEQEQLPFKAWLAGSTCPIVEGIDNDDIAYKWDYDRWLTAGNRMEIYGSMKHEGSFF